MSATLLSKGLNTSHGTPQSEAWLCSEIDDVTDRVRTQLL